MLGDLRKFAEQCGGLISWDSSNRAYVLSHGVSGIEWSHYRHPLPDNVYTIYMKSWEDVAFIRARQRDQYQSFEGEDTQSVS